MINVIIVINVVTVINVPVNAAIVDINMVRRGRPDKWRRPDQWGGSDQWG